MAIEHIELSYIVSYVVSYIVSYIWSKIIKYGHENIEQAKYEKSSKQA